MSDCLSRLRIPHTASGSPSTSLQSLLEQHFDTHLQQACENDADIYVAMASHVEECAILTIDDATGALQLAGTRRRARRHAVVCRQRSGQYVVVRVSFALHRRILFFLCRRMTPIFPTRFIVWLYVWTFVASALVGVCACTAIAMWA